MKAWHMQNQMTLTVLSLGLAVVAFGCGPKQPDFEALHPVSGKITYGGQSPGGGVVQFNPVPEKNEFKVNGVVDADGNFKLTTVRTTDTRGERRDGAPAGEYTVVFNPPNEDQTIAYVQPITLAKPVKIEAKDNVLTLDAPK
jgi:hypothetical protein